MNAPERAMFGDLPFPLIDGLIVFMEAAGVALLIL